MEIKVKILDHSPDTRGLTVQYYTEALVKAQEPIWKEETEKYMANTLWVTYEEARKQVETRYPVGAILHVDFPNDPMPSLEQLEVMLFDRVPYHWLEMKHKMAEGSLSRATPDVPVGHIFNKTITRKDFETRFTKSSGSGTIPVRRLP
jgi:hypothetical protein